MFSTWFGRGLAHVGTQLLDRGVKKGVMGLFLIHNLNIVGYQKYQPTVTYTR
jgi:hypothetical protein